MRRRNFWWKLGRGALALFILAVATGATLLFLVPPLKTEPPEAGGPVVRLQVDSGKILTMPLEQYLVGVLAAEMPANFQEEALKAQAVAARTFALKRLGAGGGQHHPAADLCPDAQHCQGWLSDQELLARWGKVSYLANRQKLEKAVQGTSGLVLTYAGQFAEPAYHANSGGRTENAREVWQSDLPYLKSVPSQWDKENPGYLSTMSFSFRELDAQLGSNLSARPALASQAGSGQAIKALSYTGTGRLKVVQVGSKTLAATDFRRLLGLPSTNLRWQVRPSGEITFTALGKGHGVGMSQYGANSLAGEGRNYQQILAYYYPGTLVGTYRWGGYERGK